MKQAARTYSGTQSAEITPREITNRGIARRAAAESIVLLQNDGVLPLAHGASLAIFGSGALHLVKGGSGSGDVNEREVVSLFQGIKDADFSIANEPWLEAYEKSYQQARDQWYHSILAEATADPDNPHSFIRSYLSHPFTPPSGSLFSETERSTMDTDTAIFVISRKSGEGKDRRIVPGDYFLTADESSLLSAINKAFSHLIVILNCGAPIDLSFLDTQPVNALVYASQPGMEGGRAIADVLSGRITPSGKLADTWAYNYEDYPSAKTFSHCSGDPTNAYYSEGIYVGYRYFDTFAVKSRFAFGFGMSYTQFAMTCKECKITETDGSQCVTMSVAIQNTGQQYCGREVVQIYVSCPQTGMKKEYQRLCAFGKTKSLSPGESTALTFSISPDQLASFDENKSAFMLESGDYVFAAGNASNATKAAFILRVDKNIILEEVNPICPLQCELQEIEPEHVPVRTLGELPVLQFSAAGASSKTVKYSMEDTQDEALAFVDTLSEEQLTLLVNGDVIKGMGNTETFGSEGLSVPGSAGETSDCASDMPWNLASIVLADGPAGLRLAQSYLVEKNGRIIKPDFIDSLERGIFSQKKTPKDSIRYYQYCTAFPVGAMLAQSWDTVLLTEVGTAIAAEMKEFGVTLWLAPGMNIHRNPLCGRNFEYFSEDPLLTGMVASAIVDGIQSLKGTGATIKHFACNNQEDYRKQSDSIISERALREIYLRGFEIAVKRSQPMALMTSYNLINGVHAPNSYDLCQKVLRNEWNFQGLVVTDWKTTGEGGTSPVGCMKVRNDLIMPGNRDDIRLVREALHAHDGNALDIRDLKRCAADIVRIIWQSLAYENCMPYAPEQKDPNAFFSSKEA